MKKVLIVFGFLILCIPLSAAETSVREPIAKAEAKPLKADIELIAIPIRARSIKAGGTVDALEKSAVEMPPVWTAVIFRVESVRKGEFKLAKNQEITLLDQVKDAADEKNFLKLLTMDFEKPPEDGTDKGWLSMAVADPHTAFGIREGEEPAVRQRYRLSLARVHKNPDSYVLVKSEKM